MGMLISLPEPKVFITTTDQRYQVIATMGATPARITDGFGGWQNVNRPRKVAMTQFQGRNPFAMQLHIMFDGYAAKLSQEHQLRTLVWMSIPPQGEREPRKVRIYGPALPYPSSGDWVINGLDQGDAVIWDANGKYRLRQDYTLTLVRFIGPDAIRVNDTSVGLSVSKSKVVSVKPGDTPRKLAAANYGDASKWHKIADANGLRDPNQIVKLKTVRIP